MTNYAVALTMGKGSLDLLFIEGEDAKEALRGVVRKLHGIFHDPALRPLFHGPKWSSREAIPDHDHDRASGEAIWHKDNPKAVQLHPLHWHEHFNSDGHNGGPNRWSLAMHGQGGLCAISKDGDQLLALPVPEKV